MIQKKTFKYILNSSDIIGELELLNNCNDLFYDLFREIFFDKKTLNNYEIEKDNLFLFFKHFIIMNILFVIQFYFYSKFNFYLNFSPLKIFLIKIPQNGDKCLDFDYNRNDFCKLEIDENSYGNCIFHYRKKTNLPAINSLRDYYSNFDNLFLVSNKTIEKILDSYFYFSVNKDKYFELLRYFDLNINCSLKDLKKSFREKIKQENDNTKKRELIENYNLLKNLFLE
ncbi:MAG: hypothetical protein N3A58_07585 [Spirochaetes bacterium]|nr:hypothetical protein [Spirochaetota bacterium]